MSFASRLRTRDEDEIIRKAKTKFIEESAELLDITENDKSEDAHDKNISSVVSSRANPWTFFTRQLIALAHHGGTKPREFDRSTSNCHTVCMRAFSRALASRSLRDYSFQP